MECRGDFLHAARSAVVFAGALGRRPPQGGCFDPEELFTLGDVDAALLDAGISVLTRP